MQGGVGLGRLLVLLLVDGDGEVETVLTRHLLHRQALVGGRAALAVVQPPPRPAQLKTLRQQRDLCIQAGIQKWWIFEGDGRNIDGNTEN